MTEEIPFDSTIVAIIADGLDAAEDGRGYDQYHHEAVRLANASPKLRDALLVLVLDPGLRRWLREHDPMALAQIVEALTEAGAYPTIIEMGGVEKEDA